MMVFLLSLVFAFETQSILVKDISLKVEVADSDAERSQGMMYRKTWGNIDGMLFVFPQERKLSFWMKNTLLPISIGFFSAQKILVDIQDMQVLGPEQKPKNYESRAPAKYALEVPKGWFEKNKVGLGSRLKLK
mgnify:CR=1 FL=1|tara:strand:- start:1373 stop:1771 length:399 start_codon:yes stop_codon:yes gene_type:complete